MLQQATDFRTESETLYQLLSALQDEEFQRPTRFKNWTTNEVIGHLHLWNWAADLSLRDSPAFEDFMNELAGELKTASMRDYESRWLGDLTGRELLDKWHAFAQEMSDRFAVADPKKRLKWAGPDMSVRSSITARYMETWAHGQAVYDLLGVVRENGDQIKNIVILGVNTFGWTYINRGLEVPPELPYLHLIAPSGDIWEWGDSSSSNSVSGAAEEFCQVVTQVRNLGDTKLRVQGNIALQWMAMAQCFAGPAEDPPPVGTRFTEPS